MSIRRETPGGPTALEKALSEGGIPCKVETRAGLAVLIATPDMVARLGDAELRRTALALAREHGFTHMAIELRSEG
ncbi:MAG: hypothetical protein V4550_05205 [Gemmatimonadota bacterium]